MSKRDNEVLLRDMLDHAYEVVQFTNGKTRQLLDEDRLFMRGLCMSIGIIGEAASKMSKAGRNAHPQIPWRDIIDMRNFLIHTYYRIDNNILWDTATQGIPPLISELEKIIPSDANASAQ